MLKDTMKNRQILALLLIVSAANSVAAAQSAKHQETPTLAQTAVNVVRTHKVASITTAVVGSVVLLGVVLKKAPAITSVFSTGFSKVCSAIVTAAVATKNACVAGLSKAKGLFAKTAPAAK